MRDYKLNLPDPKFIFKYSRADYDFSRPVYFRHSILPFDFVGKKLFIYNGRDAARFLFIKSDHLNQPLGTFVFTKSTGYTIHTEKGKKGKKTKLFYLFCCILYMITNKSRSIRLGLSSDWPSSYSSRYPTGHYTYSSFHSFLGTFFLDSSFRDRGAIFSHSLVRGSTRRLEVSNFIQDAKIVDFVNTFPRRPLFSRLNKFTRSFPYSKFTAKRLRSRKYSRRQRYHNLRFNRFFFRKSRIFYLPRSHNFFYNSFRRSDFGIFSHYLFSKRFTLFSRIRRCRRYTNSKQTYLCNFFNYFSAHQSFRLRYYSFIARFLAYFFYSSTRLPVFINLSHLLARHSTASFYLNYICTKLYYRYILNDVVRPVVRISLRYYRGFSLNCKGRFTRAQMARQKNYRRGSMAFSSIINVLDYAQKSVTLKYGTCNLKLWIRR